MARHRRKTTAHRQGGASSPARIVLALIFSIAMAFLESAVVVYIREIYYPAGFAFPLKMMAGHILRTEILREAATLLMLATAGIALGRTGRGRFGFFLLCFAVWDIFYYVFLYFLIGWPVSLLTWDVLFLIPVTWTGPVIAPLINSLTMILLAIPLLLYPPPGRPGHRGVLIWTLLVAGSLAVLYAYTQEYIRFMLNDFSLRTLLGGIQQEAVIRKALEFIPMTFQWQVYATGQILLLIAVFLTYRKK